MTITEIVIFQLKVSGSLSDKSSTASKVIVEFLTKELAAHGAQHAYYGEVIEKPEMANIFINWDSLDDHKKLMNSPDYDSNVNHLRTIANEEKPITILHVPFGPSSDPSPALGADGKTKVTEVVFYYFLSSLTDAQKDAIMSATEKFQPIMERSESLAVFDGWAVEENVPNPASQSGQKEESKVRVNVVGWVDVEAHMRFQQSQDFQENVHQIVGFKEMRHTELYHTQLQPVWNIRKEPHSLAC